MQNLFDNIGQIIQTNPALAVGLIFLAGVGVSFTPCVYPVIPITLGYITTDYAEIKEGLQEGEQVVSEARANLKDGSKVSLIETEEAGVTRTEVKMPGSEKEEKE